MTKILCYECPTCGFMVSRREYEGTVCSPDCHCGTPWFEFVPVFGEEKQHDLLKGET
jgi:hypothetical protein